MIDASKGFLKDGNKNRLRAQDIHRIVDVFNKQIELSRYSRMVPVAEIASPANDYNLNIPRYIDSSDPEDLHDLDAHLPRRHPRPRSRRARWIIGRFFLHCVRRYLSAMAVRAIAKLGLRRRR